MENKFKEFKPTSWAIDNKTSIYVLVIFLALFGIMGYNNIPKEQFPEIVIPTIIVNTVYPGTSPQDMENLVTRPIEKNIKSINGVKKVSSNSIQDISTIIVEFQTDVDIDDAKQKVKDAVDKSKGDLPDDLPSGFPTVNDIDLSEIPIMYINLSGDFTLDQIKKYAEKAQDKIEELPEITRVDIVGALDKEIQVNVNMYKMQAYKLTFSDIERAISSENLTISGGTINLQGMSRNIRVVGEFKDIESLKNIIITASGGGLVYLKDVAEVKEGFKDQDSYARLDGKNVITLNVIKKSGKNLLDASDKIKNIIGKLQKTTFPKDLNVSFSGDQSTHTRTTLSDLNNTIIIGFLLVTMVLMFFMGITNAVFVGLSVPLSMAIAYIVMPWLGFTMNMLVMFSFIFALGIVVDDAIVVIENTHRIFKKTKMDITNSAKFAAGEVFVPILAGTLTTLAPFFPLTFWPGVTGEFMYFIPVTIIITLFASLIVAYVFNPVFAVSFMKSDEEQKEMTRKRLFTIAGIFIGLGILADLGHSLLIGNLLIIFGVGFAVHNIWGYKMLRHFQHFIIPKTLDNYERLLNFILQKRRPYKLLLGLVILLIVTMGLMGAFAPKVVFFPDNEPTQIYTFIKLPVGTDVTVTDSVSKIVEKRIADVLKNDMDIVESIQANVALGSSPNPFDGGTKTSHRAKISVNFVEFSERHGKNTNKFLEKIRKAVGDVPGAEISVEKPQNGPPTGKPVNIEISSDNLDDLVETSQRFMNYLDSLKIPGADKFNTDFESTKPEVLIDLDRTRANHEGISTGQVGLALRTAVYGNEASKYREGEDQYPIQVRYEKDQRENLDKLINLDITYRDMNTGILRSIPLAALAKVKYMNSVGSISRLNLKRVITIYSNVITGYTANEVVESVKRNIPGFSKPESVDIRITGEQEDQQESSNFLGMAMLFALCLIMFILITQFNSISKPVIIVSEVLFSIVGVLLGFMITGMSISIIMTGMGVVALAGIVVRNGILLVEFTDVLIAKGYDAREAIIQAGKARITPVLLTATSTILGLIPLAIGFNINFYTLLTEFKPHIFFGGDNVMFFGPLSWTIIFGLTFATFLTLLMIPSMYYMMYSGKKAIKKRVTAFKNKKLNEKDLF